MVSQAVSMSLSNELTSYTFPHPSMMSLPWVSHNSAHTQSPFKLYAPQISPYVAPKIMNGISHPSSDMGNNSSLQIKKKNARKVNKSSYKHVPHKDKPPHLVARRNARERRRVQAVNSAFAKLRKCVPIENRNKRLSKVKTLHRAIEYINGLQAMLRQAEDPDAAPSNTIYFTPRHRSESMTSPDDDDDFEEDDDRDVRDERDDSEFQEFEEYLESDVDVVNKENEGQSWTALSTGCESNYWTYMTYNEDYSGSLTS
ncbi:achaete-scute complex protein T3-like [Stegodyphus dumicola]|uniref:achaete-scute complex protein T3-like n=1 Tax=Stegodyphus dumicola TaxID=202533 RepID=UPI0015B28056|nr:achaete-scute complex protein T3-like [Stegodyphus dumicola]